jgi:hypothetical protein
VNIIPQLVDFIEQHKRMSRSGPSQGLQDLARHCADIRVQQEVG